MFGLSDGWLWAIGGLVLLIAEMLAPGFFLIFIGAAAILTGLVTLAFDLSLPLQLLVFVVAAAIAV
jgi:inner membrane protein